MIPHIPKSFVCQLYVNVMSTLSASRIISDDSAHLVKHQYEQRRGPNSSSNIFIPYKKHICRSSRGENHCLTAWHALSFGQAQTLLPYCGKQISRQQLVRNLPGLTCVQHRRDTNWIFSNTWLAPRRVSRNNIKETETKTRFQNRTTSSPKLC